MEPKKAYKSFRYENSVVWTGGRDGVSTSPGKAEVVVSSAPEFKGDAAKWSPEDLQVGALNACLMLTFLAFASREEVAIVAYRSHAEGLLEHRDGKYRITEVNVRARVAVGSEADMQIAKEVSQFVKENCFISNSITAKVSWIPEFEIASSIEEQSLPGEVIPPAQ